MESTPTTSDKKNNTKHFSKNIFRDMFFEKCFSIFLSITVDNVFFDVFIKKLGFLVVVNNHGYNVGIFTDGDLKRLLQKKKNISHLKIKLFMTKKPYIVEENTLASEILKQMNKRKITNACVFKKDNREKIIGVIHIHDLLKTLK